MATPSPRPIIHDDAGSCDSGLEPLVPCDPAHPEQPAPFQYLTQNCYLTDTLTSRDRKRAKRMVCDCQFDPELDEVDDACGENCLNRLLMIECGSRCPCGTYCQNRRFQQANYQPVEVFKTTKKGWGLRAAADIPQGTFVMEYCGEVCTPAEFEQRKKVYVLEKRRHYYFMSLKTDEILDATRKGNLSRYINHSCDPNCETQKWTVNGKLRIGFFSVKPMATGDELTFDYKFQRFGDVAQKCYCGSPLCRGYLGQTKQQTGRLAPPGRGSAPASPREGGGAVSGKRRVRHRLLSDADTMFEKEIHEIVGSSWRLKTSSQVISISRIMLQAESPSQRMMLLQVLQATTDAGCLRKFLSLHGLRLLWSWMADSADLDSEEVMQFRIQMLEALEHLPITTKNQLSESKLLVVVRRWAERKLVKPVLQITPDPRETAEVKAVKPVLPDLVEEDEEDAMTVEQPGSPELSDALSEDPLPGRDGAMSSHLSNDRSPTDEEELSQSFVQTEQRFASEGNSLSEERYIINETTEEVFEDRTLLTVGEGLNSEEPQPPSPLPLPAEDGMCQSEATPTTLEPLSGEKSREMDATVFGGELSEGSLNEVSGEGEGASDSCHGEVGGASLADSAAEGGGVSVEGAELSGLCRDESSGPILQQTPEDVCTTPDTQPSPGAGSDNTSDERPMDVESSAIDHSVVSYDSLLPTATLQQPRTMFSEEPLLSDSARELLGEPQGGDGDLGEALTTADDPSPPPLLLGGGEGGVVEQVTKPNVMATQDVESVELTLSEEVKDSPVELTLSDGASDPAVELAINNGASDPAVELTLSDGASVPAVELTLSDGASVPAVELTINDGASDPAVEMAGKEGASDPAVELALSDGASDPAVELTLSDGASDPAVEMAAKEGASEAVEESRRLSEEPAKLEEDRAKPERDTMAAASVEVNEVTKEEEVEGTVVSEADSAACDSGGEGLAVVGGAATGEGEVTTSGQVDVMETSASESQDESQSGLEEKLATMATELLERWEGLREVFRIPKKTPQAPPPSVSRPPDKKHVSPDPPTSSRHSGRSVRSRDEDAPGETGDNEGEGSRLEERRKKSGRRVSRWEPHTPTTSTRSRKQSHLLPTPKHQPHAASMATPPAAAATPQFPPPHATPSYPPGQTTSFTTRFSSPAPLQNTVIVQQPGHSLYVQQQVFQDGLQTTILPAQSYMLPPQSVRLAPPSGHLHHPLQQQQLQQQPLSSSAAAILTGHVPPTLGGFLQQQTISQPPSVFGQTLPPHGPALNLSHGSTLADGTVLQHSLMPGSTLIPAGIQPIVSYNQQAMYTGQPQMGGVSGLTLAPLPPPPPVENEGLPPNWRTARDQQGKVYFYHAITRKSQWDKPTEQDAEGTITMDLGTPDHTSPTGGSSSGEGGGGGGGLSATARGPCTPDDDDAEEDEGSVEGREGLVMAVVAAEGGGSSEGDGSTPRHFGLEERLESLREAGLAGFSSFVGEEEEEEEEGVVGPCTPGSVSEEQPRTPLDSPPTPSSPPPSSPHRTGLADLKDLILAPLPGSHPHSLEPSDRTPSSHSHSTTSSPPSHHHTPSLSPLTSPYEAPPTKKMRRDSKNHSKTERAMKEAFRHKLSKVVTKCLDYHRKSDCKYGRITCAEDFKYLARRLSYGLTEKEILRKHGVQNLVFSDSVRIKAKDYIRTYMKKFGAVYKPT